MTGRYVIALIAAAVGAGTALAADKPVYSWKDTFQAGFEFFREIQEHPSQTPTISTAQYAMIVRNEAQDFRICRLHYTKDGKTPVGICEDIVWLDDLARDLNN